ncbi:hypothetical protein BDZ88DRAFT_79108 [Geranomyces variabilis]|nr:hypothetical protein BDZ88DRAFT_79108 [Geranomyces variabilis]
MLSRITSLRALTAASTTAAAFLRRSTPTAFFSLRLFPQQHTLAPPPPPSSSSVFSSAPASHRLSATSPSPLAPFLARGYRTRTALKLRCESCFFCRRRGKLRVECKENAKHKQKQK